MSSTWFIIALLVLAAAGILLLVFRKQQTIKGEVRHAAAVATARNTDRDYDQEREVARVAHMSVEDREWERATLQRNQDNIARAATLAEQPI